MQGRRAMSTRLYVGNLSFETTAADLRSLFEQVGTVVACELVVDRCSGRSRGFAFVEMATQNEADEAVARFNHASLDGRSLVVNEAKMRLPLGHGESSHRAGPRLKGSRRGVRRARRNRKAAW